MLIAVSDRLITAVGRIETLGERIKRAREARGYTQTYIANEVGVKASAVSQWETRNRNPKPVHFLKLARTLNKNPEWLASGEGCEEPRHLVHEAIERTGEAASGLLDQIEYLLDRANIAAEARATYKAAFDAMRRDLQARKARRG